MTVSFSRKIIISTMASILISGSATARTASHLSDLVGARGSSGEMALERQGFTYVDGHNSRKYIHTYWWHHKDKNCIEVKTADGRYKAIVDAPNSDCHQKNSSGGNGAAVAGVAVGAILLAGLLSHKSSHHDDGKHYEDQSHDTQFERGYTDGIHNVAYHNYDRSDHYSRGYEAGIEQRNQNTGYHSGRGGYSAHANLAGIKGQDSIWAIDELHARKFRDVDSFSSGDTTYGVYYNKHSDQCIQVTNADGRVYDIRDIGTHAGCH